MSNISSRPEQSTSTEASLLTALFNLTAGGTGTAIQKTSSSTFSNVTLTNQFTAAQVTFLSTLASNAWTNGQLMIGSTATGGVTFATLVAGAGVTITNGAGTITIASTSSSGITIGTTTITSGTTTRVLYDNAGVVGEMTTTGSGTVLALATSPVLVTPTLGVASATSIATSAASPLLMTNGQLLTVTITSQTTGGATLTIPDFASVSDEFVFKTKSVTMSNKTFVAPVLGAATATSINSLTITTSTGTLTITNLKTLSVSNSITLAAGADSQTFTFPSASATIAGLGTSQTFTGIQTFSPAARSSGSASYLTINAAADTGQATTVESIGINVVGATRTWVDGTTATQREYLFQAPTYNKTTTSAVFTKAATLAVSAAPTAGTGVTITNAYAFWVQAGVAQFDGGVVASTVNSMTITTSSGTFTLSNSKTFVVQAGLTLTGTDSTTMTFPGTSATIARTDAAQTFTGTQTFAQIVTTSNAITASANAATVPITSRISTVTNNSAATLTITITTTSAVDGMLVMVRILDFSAVAQTITWVNTENSTATAPTTSNGSTTLPLTVGFQFNSATTKWRCIASA